jgi:hypothetical protein
VPPVPYTVWRAALDAGDLDRVRRLAQERRVSLADAAEVVALFARQEPTSFEAAAGRWIERFVARRPRPSIEQTAEALDALSQMRTYPSRALERLRALC